jgi:hypothetical protein
MKEIIRNNANLVHKLKQKLLPPSERKTFDAASVVYPDLEERDEHGNTKTIRFVTEFYFAPATALSLEHPSTLLEVVGADGTHGNNGILFSIYSLDSNMKAYLLLHAYIAGNETKENWRKVFLTLKEYYPALDDTKITFISDRVKGGYAAFYSVFNRARLFSCYFHRKDRVIQKCKAIGRQLYKEAVFSKTLSQLKEAKKCILESDELTARQKTYLFEGLDDDEHFIIARVNGVKNVEALPAENDRQDAPQSIGESDGEESANDEYHEETSQSSSDEEDEEADDESRDFEYHFASDDEWASKEIVGEHITHSKDNQINFIKLVKNLHMSLAVVQCMEEARNNSWNR